MALPAPIFSPPTPLGEGYMVNQMHQPTQGGYDGGGINPGGGPVNPTSPYQQTLVQPPSGPMPTVPAGGIAPTPAPAPSMAPTDANPLAPLNNYQPQQMQGNYTSPTFQGQANYQAGSYTAPQVTAPTPQGYTPQSNSAPQVGPANYQAGNTQAGQVGA